MTDFPNPQEARVLRALDPPPMSVGFADRVMAGLPREATPSRTTGRDRRGGWRRLSRPLLAGVGLAVLSVGAAASGLLGKDIRNMPVIATIAETVAPDPKPAVPVKVAAKPKPAPAAAPGIVDAEPTKTPQEQWREQRAERIVDRLERRAERRAALGLPPRDPQAQRAIRRQLAAMPPVERRELIREIREERLERMTPEQRERWEAWRERRRARLEMRRDALQGEAVATDPAPVPAPVP